MTYFERIYKEYQARTADYILVCEKLSKAKHKNIDYDGTPLPLTPEIMALVEAEKTAKALALAAYEKCEETTND